MGRIRLHTTRAATALAAATLACAALVLASPPAGAAPGDLDTSFGNGGTVTFTTDSATALQGSMLAHSTLGTVLAQNSTTSTDTGDSSVVLVRRLSANGQLDPTFGSSGTMTIDLGQPAFVRDIQVTSDNHIDVLLSVGDGFSSPPQVGLARLLPGGSLDPAFGTGGVAIDTSQDGRSPVALLPGRKGSITVGLAENGQGNSDYALQRYSANGSVSGALSTFDLGGYDVLTDLVAGPAGSIYAVGFSAKPTGQAAAAIRILKNGTQDMTYGDGGVARLTSKGRGLATGEAVLAGTALLLSGAAQSGQDFDGFVGRLTSTGHGDPAFGKGGLVFLGSPGSLENATSVAPVSSTLALVSVAVEGGANSGWLTRLNIATGVADRTYGSAGRLDLPDTAFSNLLPDGNGTLLAGTRYAPAGPQEIVQRRLNS